VEIKEWLEGLALSEYEPAFREHQITADVLGDLSDDDLKSIGVAALGARKRLLKAIAVLQAGPEEASRETSPVPDPSAAMAAHVPAERRYLTLMFVDMVGSTPLSTELDPEDLGTVIGGFHAAVSTQVAAFGGFTARSFGDGVLAYFGYPQAHEDDAERAVRAALAVIEALSGATGPGTRLLEARIGIASGWVVLGDLAGTAQHDVVGETPNLAARLQSIARPGSILISKQTAQLLGNAFELVDLGSQPLKGFGTDQHAYLVSSARPSARFEAKAQGGLTALVGREVDLGVLLDRWSRVQDGDSQVVLITGEPGIGKSRTAHSLQESLQTTRYKAVRWHCSPFHVSSALHPVIGQLEAAAGFVREEDGSARFAKLRRLHLDVDDGGGTFIQVLAELLSLPGVAVPDLPPEEKKVRLFVGLTEWLRSLAVRSPVLLVVEDAHWIDPTTAELLDRMVEALFGLPAMVLVTARPEYQAPAAWTRLDRFSHHYLNRLSRRQVVELVEKVAGGVLPRELIDQIVAKTDGVPLFVEELTKAVLESGVVGKADQRFILSGALPALAVPANLQGSLMARLDRLSSAKPVAQIGAALGREFSHALIAALSDVDEAVLADALGKLQSAGLLFQRSDGGERAYAFKHALVRDAAYNSLLRSQRAALHRRIAATIEARFPMVAETEPELVARHWTEAGMAQSAVDWWRKAGQRALRRLSFQEATAHFDHALMLAPGLEPTEERDRLIARLWLECVVALRQTHWGGHRMEEAARRALSIGISLNDPTIVGFALTALAEVAAVRPDFALFREANRDFLRLELCIAEDLHTRFMIPEGRDAKLLPSSIGPSVLPLLAAVDRIAIDDDAELIRLAEDALGRSTRRDKFYSARASTIWQFIGLEMFWCGRFAAIDRILGRAIENAKADDPTYVGWHQHLLAKTWLAFSYAQLGFLDQGRELAEQCIAESDQVGELSHLVLALNAHNVFCFYCDDAGAVKECAIRLEEASFRYGVLWYQPAALLSRAWATSRTNATASVREAWIRGREMLAGGIFEQIHVGVPHLLALSAHTANAMGLAREALMDVDRGLGLIAKTGEAHSESELYRAKGEILLGMGDIAGGEQYYRTALEVGRRQSARGLQLRAAISLGRLLCEQQRADEALDVLAPIYSAFTEGFGAPIMMQARALLDELGQTPGGQRRLGAGRSSAHAASA
jgi:class 3 adenylate cyclase/tetratricopeptide (TPR) repeat protein